MSSYEKSLNSNYNSSSDLTSYINQNTNVIGKKNNELDKLIPQLDSLIFQIAKNFCLFSKGDPRRAFIIEALSKNTCITCLKKQLDNHIFQSIDGIYDELHHFALSVLLEALYKEFDIRSCRIRIIAEESIKYGTADILLEPYNKISNDSEILIEIKTGFSISISQLLRYLIDNENRSIFIWRIRNQQILFVQSSEVQSLIIHFTKMLIFRANRFLQTKEFSCNHLINSKVFTPTSVQIQESISDFSTGLTKTLPFLVKNIASKFEGEKFYDIKTGK